MIEKYLEVPYVDSGRTMSGLDCWGVVLAVRADLGAAPLPQFDSVVWDRPRENQQAFRKALETLEQTDNPQQGDIAAVMHGVLCLHVGVVLLIDGRLAVMDTNVGKRPRWQWLTDFRREFYQVAFYSDR